MRIERLDAARLDPCLADCLAAISNASAQDAGLHIAPVTGASLAVQAAYGHDNRPSDGFWIAHHGGQVVAHASLDLPVWDNRHLALVFCSVHPLSRGRGIGTALLSAQAESASAAGRSMLLTYAFRDTPAEKFLVSQGFESAQRTAQRRLRPAEIDYDLIQSYADEAAAVARDYETVTLDGPAPEEWLPQLQRLFEAINDAPLDDIDMGPDSFPIERIRRYEQAMAARGQHVYRLMARHRDTGEWAGHTIVCVDTLRPGAAMQEDTSVLPAHRGHRLGMLLKARMLLWLREVRPELEMIDTWNAETNSHMIAINDALGCVVEARGSVLQRRLHPAESGPLEQPAPADEDSSEL